MVVFGNRICRCQEAVLPFDILTNVLRRRIVYVPSCCQAKLGIGLVNQHLVDICQSHHTGFMNLGYEHS